MVFLLLALLWTDIFTPPSAKAQDCPTPRQLSFRVLRTIQRSSPGFTEGLVFHDGRLYETTGLYEESAENIIDPRTGQVTEQSALPAKFFGEGLDYWNGVFLELTWRENVVFLWNEDLSSPILKTGYPWDGWGLTHDGISWIASDGSNTLHFLSPDDLQEEKSLNVFLGSRPLDSLNELEYAEGKIFANVYPTDMAVRIDPDTGCVDGTIDLSSLESEGVPNGIAYDPSERVFYVTGKNWQVIFKIRLTA